MNAQITIVTFKPEGIERIAAANLPYIDNVEYLVSWQAHQDYPLPDAIARRDDFKVLRYNETGVANNRNNAIEHSTADIIFLMDDDLVIYPEGVKKVIEFYEENPEADVLIHKAVTAVPKHYPDRTCRIGLPLPKNYYFSMWEMSFRRSSASAIRVCPKLGAGNPEYTCGDDTVLLLSVLKRGLKTFFLPAEVVAHLHKSAGVQDNVSPGILRSMGLSIALQFPATAILRIPLKAWRTYRRQATPFFKALRHLTAGAVDAPRFIRENRDYLW